MRNSLCIVLFMIHTTLVYSQSRLSVHDVDAAMDLNDGEKKLELKDYRGAIVDFTQAIAEDPNYATAYNKRGRAKMSLQDFRGAIVDFNKVIELNTVLLNKYKNNIDKTNDIADFQEYGIKLAEIEWRDAYVDRGSSKFAIQDFKGAIVDFTKNFELYPRYARIYYLRGMSKIMLDQKEGGCLDLSKAGELGYAEAYDAIKQSCK